MPVVRDTNGRSAYVPDEYFHEEHPSDFLQDAHQSRVDLAKNRVLTVIRFYGTHQHGRGLNHEVHLDDHSIQAFVQFIDEHDGKRSRRVRTAVPYAGKLESRVRMVPRSPQDTKRRRRALFSYDDVPDQLMKKTDDPATNEAFIDLMRWLIFEDAIQQMIQDREIQQINGSWYVSVRVMDEFRIHPKRHRRNVKRDDRSFHGRPNRDRSRIAA